ncbi:helix-turn-helix transcriptional regulator [bacterium]|nr:helix-turn-helix transcriptional regulator [bacterium]MBU3930088.1 helix-turn-helix transcriptional regulator [bacterium]
MSSKNINYLKNLAEYRLKRDLTQKELARKSGVSYNTIIKIERGGITNPKIETIVKLAKALKISLDKLVCKKL